MMNKKFLSLMVTGALISAMSAVPAFAAPSSTGVPVCTVSSCTMAGEHQHDGATYAAHTALDGHTYHNSCGVPGCSQTGDHTSHNGNYNDGICNGNHNDVNCNGNHNDVNCNGNHNDGSCNGNHDSGSHRSGRHHR